MNVHFKLDEAGSPGHLSVIRGQSRHRSLVRYQNGLLLSIARPDQEMLARDGGQVLMSNTTQIFSESMTSKQRSMSAPVLAMKRLWSIRVAPTPGILAIVLHRRATGGRPTRKTRSCNWQQQGRRLLKTEEVMGLSPRTTITFPPAGMNPICTTLVPYYNTSSNRRAVRRHAGGRGDVCQGRAARCCSRSILAVGATALLSQTGVFYVGTGGQAVRPAAAIDGGTQAAVEGVKIGVGAYLKGLADVVYSDGMQHFELMDRTS